MTTLEKCIFPYLAIFCNVFLYNKLLVVRQLKKIRKVGVLEVYNLLSTDKIRDFSTIYRKMRVSYTIYFLTDKIRDFSTLYRKMRVSLTLFLAAGCLPHIGKGWFLYLYYYYKVVCEFQCFWDFEYLRKKCNDFTPKFFWYLISEYSVIVKNLDIGIFFEIDLVIYQTIGTTWQ